MKPTRRTLNTTLAATLLAPWLARPAAAATAIRVASVDALSGPVGNMGTDTYRGEQVAADEINAAGGIKSMGGAKITLVSYDTESKVQMGQSLAERAIGEGAVALLGTTQSSVSLATTTVAERAKIPHIVTGSAANEITKRGYKYTFRVLVTSDLASAPIVSELRLLLEPGIKLKTVAGIYEDSAYGQSATATYRKVFEAAGIEYQDFSVKTGSADMAGVASRLKRVNAQAALFSGYVKDAITLIDAMREADVNFPLFNTTAGVTDPAFVSAMGAANAEGYIGIQYFNKNVRPAGNPDGPRKFYDAYTKRFGEPGFLSAIGYVSMRTLGKALEAAGSTDPEKLRAALASVELKPEDGMILPYKMIKFDEFGQNLNANAPLAQLINGELQVIWPPEYATAKALVPMPTWKQKLARR